MLQSGWSANERQSIDLHASSGSFTLSFAGKTTVNLSVTSTAAEIQNALEALDTIGRGNVVVTGNARHWVAEFTGDLSGKDVALLTASMAGATAGGLVEVSSDKQTRSTTTGVVSGRLVFAQHTFGTFDEFKVSPSSGVSIVNVTSGTTTADAVQRIYVINGAGGSFTLSGVKADGETPFTATVSWPAEGVTLSSTLQTAINTALETTAAGTGVVVTLNQTLVVNQGVQVFDVAFSGTSVAKRAFELMTSNADSLLMKPAAQVATLTLTQGSVLGGVAQSEVQQIGRASCRERV